MVNTFRLKQALGKLRKLLPTGKSADSEVIEIKDPEIDTSKLDDTDFEYFYPNEVLVKIPKAMLVKLTDEEVVKMLKNVKQEKKFDQKDQTICIATENTRRPWYSRAIIRKDEPMEPIASTSYSENSEQNRPCTLKLRREDRKGLDILHDTICYSQYEMREQNGVRSQAAAINDFLNTITNDIVDVNKEAIPKDPERLPALGAGGMYPTKKWLADLKRRGIKPEPNKHYRELRTNTRAKSGFTRRMNHILGNDDIYPWRQTEHTSSLKRDDHQVKKRRDGKNVRMMKLRHQSLSYDSFSD